MYKDSRVVIPYDCMDEEVVGLCKALNNIDGVETIESCCGHGEYNCYVELKVTDITTLNRLAFHCFNGENYWKFDPWRTWNDIHLILRSDDICDASKIQELADRINKYSGNMKLTDDEWFNLRDE